MTGDSAPSGSPGGVEETAERLRAELAEELWRSGAVTSPQWRRAFATVPRHVFVPQLFVRTDTGRLRPVDGNRPEQRSEWLAAAYAMTTQTTQIDGRPFSDFTPGEAVGGEPTSSATQPDAMAGILEALEIEDGMRVLEVGTGSGYNAALLAQRLGSGQVVSVEVDADVASAARRKLTSCGFTSEVVIGDGLLGYAGGAPYDRVIATAAVPAVPASWLRQTVPGGRIVVNLSGGVNSGAVAVLEAGGPGEAEGAFLRWPVVYFMPVRVARVPVAERLRLLDAASERPGAPRSAEVDAEVLEHDGFALVAQLVLGDAARVEAGNDDGSWTTWLISPSDGSAAAVTPGAAGRPPVVVESGPRRLWTALESALARWREAGEPGRERFRLSVREGRQRVWLSAPGEDAHGWEPGRP